MFGHYDSNPRMIFATCCSKDFHYKPLDHVSLRPTGIYTNRTNAKFLEESILLHRIHLEHVHEKEELILNSVGWATPGMACFLF